MKTEKDGSRYWEEGDEVYALEQELCDDNKTYCTKIRHGKVTEIDENDAVQIMLDYYNRKRWLNRQWTQSSLCFPTKQEANDYIEELKKKNK